MISYDYPVLKNDYENAGMVSSVIKGTLKQIGIPPMGERCISESNRRIKK